MKYCFTLFILTVFIAPRLHAKIAGDSLPCFGSQQIYSIPAAASPLIWAVSGGNIGIVLGGNQFRVQWTAVGTYYIASSYNLADSCHHDTLLITVQPLPSPLIKVINSQSGCQFTGITFLPSKTGNYATSNTCYSVCDSGLYAYAAKGWPGSTFSWSSAGSNHITTNASGDTSWIDWNNPLPPLHTILETEPLTVVETSTAGCKDSTAICIGVNGKPHACFTSSPPDSAGIINICLGTKVSFSDSCSWVPEWYLHNGSIIDRTWKFGDGTEILNQSLVSHQYNSAGNYTMTYIATSNCYCSDTFTKTVHVNPATGPDIECISSVCHNTWAYYYVKDTCSHHFYWTVQGADSIRASNDTLFVKWDSCNNGYGTISVTTDCGSYCPYQTTVRVPVVPAVATITGDTVICYGQQYPYSIPFVPSTFYQWYADTGAFGHRGAEPNSNSYQYLFSAPSRRAGFYLSATYTNSFLGCSGNATLKINISPTVIAQFILGDSIICEGDSLKIKASNLATGGLVGSNWSVYLASNDSLVDTLVGNCYYFTNTLAPGTYVIYTYPDTGIFCNTPYSTLVTVLSPPPPVAAPVIGQDTVCPNFLLKYYSLPTDPIQYYLGWTAVNGTAAPRTGNGASVIWNTPLPDTLIVQQFMFQEPGCASSPVKIPIYSFPVITPAISGDTSTCSDGINSYKTPFQADNYNWSIFPPTSGSVRWGQGNDSISIQWNHFTADTIARILLIGQKCTYPDSSIITVYIHPAPLPAISISPASPYCTGESLTFTSLLTGNRYIWNFGDGNTFTSNADDTTHAFAGDSSYVVTLTVDTPSGCMVNTTTSVTISPLPSPIAVLTTPQSESHCGDGSFTNELDITPQNLSGSTFSYTFYQTTSGTPISGPGSVDSFAVTSIGSYYAVVSANGCSSNTDTISIDNTCFGYSGGTVCDASYYISASDVAYCDSVVFTATTSSNVTFSNWFFDDNFSVNNTVSTATASHIYTHAGYYHPTASGSPNTGTCLVVPGQLTVAIPLAPDFTTQFKCERGVMHSQLLDLSTYINPITTWNWSVDGTPFYNTQNVDTPIAAGGHIIQLVISDGVNTCSISKAINVPAPAVASYTVADNRCITLPIQFTSTSTGNISSYLWAFGDTSYSALQNTSKVYARCYSAHFSGCTENDTLTIIDVYGCQSSIAGTVGYYIDPFADTRFILNPQTMEACSNTPEQIYLTPSTFTFAGDTFQWSNDVVTTTNSLTINQSGNYTVTISDDHGCSAAPYGAVSLIYNTVQGLIVGDKYYCYNDYSNLNIFQGYQYQYYWIYNHGGTNSTTLPATSHGYIFNKQMTGFCAVWGVIRDSLSPTQFCDDTLGPDTLFTFNDPTGPPGESQCVDHHPAQFIASPSGSYFTLWNTGLLSDTLNTSIPGIYTAEYIDTNGCIGTAEGVFTALGGPDFSEMIFGCYTYCYGDTPKLYVPQNLLAVTSRHWLLNGLPLSNSYTFNANGDIWAIQPGAYQLVDTATGGCADTSQPIHINFTYCDSTCFKHANIFCSNCYVDSSSGKRYLSLIISIADTIGTGLPVTIASEQLRNITFWPNTLIPDSGTCYLNIRGVADSAESSYCVEVSFGHCHQLFCLNAADLPCSRLSAERMGIREDAVRIKPKYIKSYKQK